MHAAHIIWKLWLVMCALWLAMLAAVVVWLAPAHDWTEAVLAAVLYGAAPIIAGSVLIYWSFLIAPWRPDRQE